MRYLRIILFILSCSQLPNSLAQPTSGYLAEYQRGVAAMQTGQPQQAYAIWLPLAEIGMPQAQFALSSMFLEGRSWTPNIEEGMYWLFKAAENNHPIAQYRLGAAYEIGIGVPSNMRHALYWWGRAAKQGMPQAQQRFQQALWLNNGVWQTHPYPPEIQPTAPPASSTPSHMSTPIPQAEKKVDACEDWFTANKNQSHTLQLMAGKSRDSITRLAKDLGLEDSMICPYEVNGTQWYGLYTGHYPNAELARQAITQLPDVVRKYKPFIRNLKRMRAALLHTQDTTPR